MLCYVGFLLSVCVCVCVCEREREEIQDQGEGAYGARGGRERRGGIQGGSGGYDVNLLSELSNAATKATREETIVKPLPDAKDSLEKDALVRQMGVKPSSQNPNLFSDLLG